MELTLRCMTALLMSVTMVSSSSPRSAAGRMLVWLFVGESAVMVCMYWLRRYAIAAIAAMYTIALSVSVSSW